MKKLTLLIQLILLVVFVQSSVAQTRFKTMFLNLLEFSTSLDSRQRTPHIKTILDDVNPDLFMVCELMNEPGSELLYEEAILPHNASFSKADFVTSQSPATGLHQMVYYNSDKLELTASTVIPTDTRDINHYTFLLLTETSADNPLYLDVFVTHLKASTGDDNRAKRLASATKFVEALNSLPTDRHVLFSGDFNFYTSNEEGYQSIINPNNAIVMVDPINRPCPEFPNDGVDYFNTTNYNATYFWNNDSFQDIHTQSTRTTNSGLIDDDGATGGMDDRFDFIMLSNNFNTSNDLYYVDDSYKAIGNNGNCYNSYANNTNCSGDFSQDLRDAVIEASDHLPVVLEIETRDDALSTTETSNSVSIIDSNFITNELQLNFNTVNVRNIYIYNQLGQLISDTDVNTTKVTLDINYLAKGLYFLRTDKHQRAIKFIKK